MGCDGCTCGDQNCGSPVFSIERTIKDFADDFVGSFIFSNEGRMTSDDRSDSYP